MSATPATAAATTIAPGDFQAIPGMDSWEAEMLKDVYDAVSIANMWDDMKKTQVESFMFHGPSWAPAVHKYMKLLDTHSGSSYGITMRNIESIAKDGWDAFVTARIAYYETKKAREAALKAERQLQDAEYDPQRNWARQWRVEEFSGTATTAAAATAAATAAANPDAGATRDRADTEEAALDARRQERHSPTRA
jgi:hypothetical protein